MNLFIDTNIFLSFFHLSSDDLQELKKLAVLVRTKKIVLHLTEQVTIEFRRNRALKIADALKRLHEQRTTFQFPQFCKDYEQYGLIRKSLKETQQALSTLLAKVEEDISYERLKADEIIKEIFDSVGPIATTEPILNAARKRIEIGNPPGKDNSLGDAINWEALLSVVPNNQDLVLVTDDKDYISPLNDSELNPFLLSEWSARKNSQIRFYRRLSAMLGDLFPDIKLETELEKEELIREFAASPNFASTHIAIAKLSKYSDFSTLQINEIVAAVITNSQISWIIADEDVSKFIANVIRGREQIIDAHNHKALLELVSGSK
jgi:predicted nucleic acid-binding protein